jgi:hypothetical protein
MTNTCVMKPLKPACSGGPIHCPPTFMDDDSKKFSAMTQSLMARPRINWWRKLRR